MTDRSGDRRINDSWEWPAIFGVLIMVLGAGLMGIPIVATIGISWLLGLAFVFSGVAQFIHAIRFTKDRGWASRYLLASLSLAAGIVALWNPLAGAVGITLVLSYYLLLSSVARGLLAIEMQKVKGRGWLIVSSLITFALGVYLLSNLATDSWVVPGTLLGVDLIFYGASLTVIAGRFRTAPRGFGSVPLRRVA